MAKLKGTVAPTRKTAGAIGDIYIDTSTGKKYECVFAYRDDTDVDFDCQWKELAIENKAEKPDAKITEPVEEPEVEEVKESSSKYTDYSSYGRKKNRNK